MAHKIKIGIYGWKNTVTGMWYIGQTTEMSRRSSWHWWALLRGGHHNPKMQRSFNKHGQAAFEFHILEECAEEMLDMRERAWISYYKADQNLFGYNCDSGGSLHKRFTPEVLAKLKEIQSKRGPDSPEVKARKKIAQKKRAENLSSEERKAMSDKAKGRFIDDEWKAKMAAAAKARWAKEEERKKQSNRIKGKSFTSEVLEKIRQGNLRWSQQRKELGLPYHDNQRKGVICG